MKMMTMMTIVLKVKCKSMPLVRRGLTPSLLFILRRSK